MQGSHWQAADCQEIEQAVENPTSSIAGMSKLSCPGLKLQKLLDVYTWLDAAERLLEVSVADVSHTIFRCLLYGISKLPANNLVCINMHAASMHGSNAAVGSSMAALLLFLYIKGSVRGCS